MKSKSKVKPTYSANVEIYELFLRPDHYPQEKAFYKILKTELKLSVDNQELFVREAIIQGRKSKYVKSDITKLLLGIPFPLPPKWLSQQEWERKLLKAAYLYLKSEFVKSSKQELYSVFLKRWIDGIYYFYFCLELLKIDVLLIADVIRFMGNCIDQVDAKIRHVKPDPYVYKYSHYSSTGKLVTTIDGVIDNSDSEYSEIEDKDFTTTITTTIHPKEKEKRIEEEKNAVSYVSNTLSLPSNSHSTLIPSPNPFTFTEFNSNPTNLSLKTTHPSPNHFVIPPFLSSGSVPSLPPTSPSFTYYYPIPKSDLHPYPSSKLTSNFTSSPSSPTSTTSITSTISSPTSSLSSLNDLFLDSPFQPLCSNYSLRSKSMSNTTSSTTTHDPSDTHSNASSALTHPPLFPTFSTDSLNLTSIPPSALPSSTSSSSLSSTTSTDPSSILNDTPTITTTTITTPMPSSSSSSSSLSTPSTPFPQLHSTSSTLTPTPLPRFNSTSTSTSSCSSSSSFPSSPLSSGPLNLHLPSTSSSLPPTSVSSMPVKELHVILSEQWSQFIQEHPEEGQLVWQRKEFHDLEHKKAWYFLPRPRFWNEHHQQGLMRFHSIHNGVIIEEPTGLISKLKEYHFLLNPLETYYVPVAWKW